MAPGEVITCPIPSVQSQQGDLPGLAEDLNFEQRFRRYLHGHCEGIADNMWDSNTFEMQLHFYTIRASHKLLSDEIVRNHKNMKAELKAALVDYLKVQFTKKPYAKKYADLDDMVHKIRLHSKLTFLDVPDTSIEPLEDMFDVPLSGPNKRYKTLFAKHPQRKYKVPITTDSQLLILIGSIDHLLQNHKEGKSWGGAWTREDWVIIDGIPCLHAAGEPANQVSCKLDLAQYGQEFLLPFAHKDGRYPANMESLFQELSSPLVLPDHEFFGWYYEFLAFHPCFFRGPARRMLVTAWYHLVEYLRYDQKYAEVFGDEVLWTAPFQNEASVDKVLWLVFWDGKTPGFVLPYSDTLGQNFRLVRQVQEHAYRCTKLIGDAQTAERSDETDLYAEDQFPYVLAQLIKTFSNNRMVGEFLEHYEDFKKLRGNSNNEVHPEDVEGSELEGTGSA
ncbi:hypothetical protein ACQ4PT_059163 [Festuca glaucescens]